MDLWDAPLASSLQMGLLPELQVRAAPGKYQGVNLGRVFGDKSRLPKREHKREPPLQSTDLAGGMRSLAETDQSRESLVYPPSLAAYDRKQREPKPLGEQCIPAY